MAKFSDIKKRLLENAEVKEEYEKSELEYKIINEIIKARIEKNMTQKELAELVGTRQSNISRLESGEYNPSLQFLKKIAKAMGKELDIILK